MAWDSERDAALVELHSQGLSFRQISARLGVTRNAALGRYQRVVRKKFPSESAKARSELRLERRAIAILKLRRDLAAGVEPQTAILRALGAGAGGGLIATELNVPPHRVYQLVAADRCEAAERRPAIEERAHRATLYLEPETYERLRDIAHIERTKVHSLILEGIEAVLKKRAKKTAA
jgi:IS30 family transposase